MLSKEIIFLKYSKSAIAYKSLKIIDFGFICTKIVLEAILIHPETQIPK
jgi:hypothetical protein